MATMNRKGRRARGAQDPPPEVIDRLAELLPEGALDDAVRGLKPEELSGPGGLLSQLAGRVVEAAMDAEMTEHLGHPPGGVPQGANVRNGSTPKTVQTDLGPIEIKTPRDREGTFEPRIVPKRQTRLAGLDEKVIGLYAGGMTVRDISHHLSEIYGTEIGRDTISRITDAVLEDVQAWRTRPLEQVYPIVYFDAMRVKVREDRSVKNLAAYLALGVTVDGEREVLGIWWQETEGAKFWLAVLNDLHRRGVQDVLIACVDGLTGFPDAIEAVFPQTWVQTCVVHLIRASLRYVNYRDLKKVASALRPIYTAANADDALIELDRFDSEWGQHYPATVKAWRDAWEHVTPFLSLPEELRKAVYTTNTIEGLHRQIRKAIKTRGAFPDQQAATKLIYLAIIRADAKWQRSRTWSAPRAALKIHFGDRYPG
ncbi:MAG TPA: IS256 family transposase [Solirubrobacter sp.]|nr:IS256 family transposase [Solirubrobacter sp.]